MNLFEASLEWTVAAVSVALSYFIDLACSLVLEYHFRSGIGWRTCSPHQFTANAIDGKVIALVLGHDFLAIVTNTIAFSNPSTSSATSAAFAYFEPLT